AAQLLQLRLPNRAEFGSPVFLIAILFRGIRSDPAIDETAIAGELADGSARGVALQVFCTQMDILYRAFLNSQLPIVFARGVQARPRRGAKRLCQRSPENVEIWTGWLTCSLLIAVGELHCRAAVELPASSPKAVP